MKNKYLIWGAVAIGAYLVWKKMNNSNPTGRELAPPPVSNPPISKPPNNVSPKIDDRSNTHLPNGCPTKEFMARARYSAEGIEKLKAMGCI